MNREMGDSDGSIPASLLFSHLYPSRVFQTGASLFNLSEPAVASAEDLYEKLSNTTDYQLKALVWVLGKNNVLKLLSAGDQWGATRLHSRDCNGIHEYDVEQQLARPGVLYPIAKWNREMGDSDGSIPFFSRYSSKLHVVQTCAPAVQASAEDLNEILTALLSNTTDYNWKLKRLVLVLGKDNVLKLLSAGDQWGATGLHIRDCNGIHDDVEQQLPPRLFFMDVITEMGDSDVSIPASLLFGRYPWMFHLFEAGRALVYKMLDRAAGDQWGATPLHLRDCNGILENDVEQWGATRPQWRGIHEYDVEQQLPRPSMECGEKNEDKHYKERMECFEKRLDNMSKASVSLCCAMFTGGIYAAPNNANFAVWSPVCLTFGTAAFVATLMGHHKHGGNMKATILYQSHLFFISVAMFLAGVLCFLFGPLMAPNLSFSKTPALQSLLIGPIVLTVLVCVASRVYTTRKLV